MLVVDADVDCAVGVDFHFDAGDSADAAVDESKRDVDSTWHSRECGSIQLPGCGDARKGCYIQVGMAPPQLLIIYLHQPALHMPLLHYQLCQQLHTILHIVCLLPLTNLMHKQCVLLTHLWRHPTSINTCYYVLQHVNPKPSPRLQQGLSCSSTGMPGSTGMIPDHLMTRHDCFSDMP